MAVFVIFMGSSHPGEKRFYNSAVRCLNIVGISRRKIESINETFRLNRRKSEYFFTKAVLT